MIVTILQSSASFHAIEYNERKVKGGRAELIEMRNVFGISDFNNGYTVDELRNYFIEYSFRNDRIQKPQFHVAISCKGHEYTVEQLQEFAHKYMSQMGYMEPGQPMVIYAHHDTDNTHIHIITSRVGTDGKKINDSHERRKSQAAIDRILNIDRIQETINHIDASKQYRFSSESQFCAILQSMGLQTSIDKDNQTINVFGQGSRKAAIPFDEILCTPISKDDEERNKRLKQLTSIVRKYQQLSVDKSQLQDTLKRQFGIDLVFHGSKDSPYGYTVVDHSTKRVFAGGEVMNIKQLLDFESPETKIYKGLDIVIKCLSIDDFATTKEINQELRRRGCGFIKDGKLYLGGTSHDLLPETDTKIRENNKIAYAAQFSPTEEGERGAIAKMFRIDSTRFSDYLDKKCQGTRNPFGRADEFKAILADASSRKDYYVRMKGVGLKTIEYNGEHYIVDKNQKSICSTSSLGVDYQTEMGRLSASPSQNRKNRPIKRGVGGGSHSHSKSSKTLNSNIPSVKPTAGGRLVEGISDGSGYSENREWEVGKDRTNDYTLS